MGIFYRCFGKRFGKVILLRVFCVAPFSNAFFWLFGAANSYDTVSDKQFDEVFFFWKQFIGDIREAFSMAHFCRAIRYVSFTKAIFAWFRQHFYRPCFKNILLPSFLIAFFWCFPRHCFSRVNFWLAFKTVLFSGAFQRCFLTALVYRTILTSFLIRSFSDSSLLALLLATYLYGTLLSNIWIRIISQKKFAYFWYHFSGTILKSNPALFFP